MDLFTNLFITFLALYCVMVPKGKLAMEVYKLSSKKELRFTEKVMCFAPVYNNFIIRRSLHGKSNFFLMYTYMLALIFTINFVVRMWFYTNQQLLVVMTLIILVTLLSMWVMEAFVMVELSLMFSGIKTIAAGVIFPPVAAAILHPIINKRIKEEKDRLEGTFDGRKKSTNTKLV